MVIPARGGSKGIPKKNIRPLVGKPLILYTTELAREIFSDNNICVSTDSEEIKQVVEQTGLSIPFIRPDDLASDTASSRDVLLHAIDYYHTKEQRKYDRILLLQPTTPFRKPEHVTQVAELFSDGIDMVVSVVVAKANPYYTLFEADTEGYLKKSKEGKFARRQDCPTVFQLNGSMYMINVESIIRSDMSEFNKVLPYPMEDLYSIDIDTELDWKFAEVVSQSLK
ncbi:MAG: cytidylyltransferase domain-containing protein [Cyclobacteriaceae bacterium]